MSASATQGGHNNADDLLQLCVVCTRAHLSRRCSVTCDSCVLTYWQWFTLFSLIRQHIWVSSWISFAVNFFNYLSVLSVFVCKSLYWPYELETDEQGTYNVSKLNTNLHSLEFSCLQLVVATVMNR